MYSPKINETLISPLYHKAKEKGIPMTKLVNEILSQHLSLELQPEKCAETKLEFYSTDQSKEAS